MHLKKSLVRTVVVCAIAAVGIGLLLSKALGHKPSATSPVVAEFRGGTVTEVELEAALQRLPPSLRVQFQSPAGREELLQTVVDKKLLALEARARKLQDEPEIRRQVDDLQDRLITQALLDQATKAAAPIDPKQEEADFLARRREFVHPEKFKLIRILVSVGPGASSKTRAAAQARAISLLRRLQGGEPPARVASAGDGAENHQGGSLGWVEARALPQVALTPLRTAALNHPVGPLDTPEGYAVYIAQEHQVEREMTFAEARPELEGREDAKRRRRAFDDLIASLRRNASVRLSLGKSP